MGLSPSAVRALRALVTLQCAAIGVLSAQLTLTVALQKTEFFEGEPLYVAFELTNHGADTAWTWPLDPSPDRLTVEIRKHDGTRVRATSIWIDRAFPPTYRGEPLAPGESDVQVYTLQDLWGDDHQRQHVFVHHMGPGTYTLRASFDSRVTPEAGGEGTVFLAQPAMFTIRPASQLEESAFKEVGDVFDRAFARPTRAQYAGALLSLLERRWAENPLDPFLPHLLTQGVTLVWATNQSLTVEQARRVSELQRSVATAQADRPAGALVAIRLHRDVPVGMSAPDTAGFGTSLASRAVLAVWRRTNHPQH